MRYTPKYLLQDVEEIKRMIRHNPWATFISHTSNGLIASHYPVLLDEEDSGITILSHFGRPDDELHELASYPPAPQHSIIPRPQANLLTSTKADTEIQKEMLVIIQGPHDYVSASWYTADDFVPTWNHVTAHLYGIPEIMPEEENFAMLSRLTEHFEKHYPGGRSLQEDEDKARRIAKGTVGLRLRVTRFDARVKLSQGKSQEVAERIMHEFDSSNPALATEMRRVRKI